MTRPTNQQPSSPINEQTDRIITVGDLVKFDLRRFAQIKPDGPGVTVLSDTGAARTVLFTFAAGQGLKDHQTSSQIQVIVLRGRITFTANGGAVKARAGTLLQLEARVQHAISADTNATVLVIMTPSPATNSQPHDALHGRAPLISRVTADTSA